MKIQIVSTVSPKIEHLLGISVGHDRNIYLGQSNIEHMKKSHPQAFAKYGAELVNILTYPDYVGQNPSDGSIEYVKEFFADGDYVKVAVRLSKSDRYYARSLYVLNKQRTERFIARGTLIKT